MNGAKGISGLQLARDIDVQHKTAWVLVHKLREAMEAETENATVDGVGEVDGAHFGGHIRPTNLAKDRVDRCQGRAPNRKAPRCRCHSPTQGPHTGVRGAHLGRVLGLALHHPVSRDWKGYWQRAQAA